MEIKALITMIVLISISWGGFLYCLYLALKKEAAKTRKHNKE
jgi:hypothetical protein